MGNYVEPESNPASPYSHHCLKCTHTVPPSLAIFEPAELPPLPVFRLPVAFLDTLLPPHPQPAPSA